MQEVMSPANASQLVGRKSCNSKCGLPPSLCEGDHELVETGLLERSR